MAYLAAGGTGRLPAGLLTNFSAAARSGSLEACVPRFFAKANGFNLAEWGRLEACVLRFFAKANGFKLAEWGRLEACVPRFS
jgi:hypothetical protein